MKEFLIGDCVRHENEIIVSSFVVVSKQVKPKKTGEPYLALTLGDRTGQLEAKMWDNVEDALNAFEQEDFIKIKGLLNKYKKRFQITRPKSASWVIPKSTSPTTFLKPIKISANCGAVWANS